MTEATTWNRMAPPALEELPLFAPAPLFGGTTYDADRDEARLTGQLGAVFGIMKDGQWRTLAWIVYALAEHGKGASEAGVSARLRDLRKPKFGGHAVERRRVAEWDLWEYRVEVNHG